MRSILKLENIKVHILLLVFVLFGIFFVSLTASELNYTKSIRGKVLDKRMHRPIVGAKIICTWISKSPLNEEKRREKVIKTDKKGNYRIPRKYFWGCPALGTRIMLIKVDQRGYKNYSRTFATMNFKNPYNWVYTINENEGFDLCLEPKNRQKSNGK